MVEARPAGGFSIKGRIGVKVTADNRNAQVLDELEGSTEVVLQLEGVVVVACDNASGGEDETVGVGDGQNIGRFGFLASLISHRFTAFLGWRVAAVKVKAMGVDLLMDADDAVLKHPLQATIVAPFAIVVVDGMIADFFFCGSLGSLSMGRRSH